jgi:hypothetical protein
MGGSKPPWEKTSDCPPAVLLERWALETANSRLMHGYASPAKASNYQRTLVANGRFERRAFSVAGQMIACNLASYMHKRFYVSHGASSSM